MTERELIERLAIEDPWSRSTEGLDDACKFCGNYRSRYIAPHFIYGHQPQCVWIEAMAYLGRELPPDHAVMEVTWT